MKDKVDTVIKQYTWTAVASGVVVSVIFAMCVCRNKTDDQGVFSEKHNDTIRCNPGNIADTGAIVLEMDDPICTHIVKSKEMRIKPVNERKNAVLLNDTKQHCK